MTSQIALTLAIIVAAVILFASEKLRVDVVALLVLLTLVLTGLVTPEEAFAGFANPAVITVWAVYIVSGGLFKTGVADFLGQQITRLAGKSEPRLIAVIMLTCGTMSAFMNNIGAVAVLLPAVVGISRQAKVPLSRLLIPLAFSSLLGGNITLIGTPPNILAASILADRGLPTFRFFDFAPTGLIVFGVGVLYMVFIGRHLIPIRASVEEQQVQRLREYITEIRVPPDSPLVGKTLVESRLGTDYDVTVLAIVHPNGLQTAVGRDTLIQPNDLLIVEAPVEKLMRAREALNFVIEPRSKMKIEQLESDQLHIFEATLAPRSPLIGRTLKEVRFRERYGFNALAIWRHGEVIIERLHQVRLQFGDALLLEGPRDRLPELLEANDFLILEPVKLEQRRFDKAPLAVGAMALVLVLVTLLNFHISTAMVIGAVLMVLTRCLSMEQAYESIEWRSVFLIAGMLPLGTAMESTGTAQYLADWIVRLLGGFGPLAVLAGMYLLVTVLTQPMSNAAATVLIAPIAIDIALSLGANPQPFVLATVIGASTSFLTPVGHQVNVLVFGPGGYRFFDYTRTGGPMTLVILIATLIFLPMIWPLF